MSLINTVKENPAVVENQIIAAFIGSKKFFYDYGESIRDLSSELGPRHNKFESYINKIIFEAVCEFRDKTKVEVVPKEFIVDYIDGCKSTGKILPEEVENINNYLSGLYTRANVNTANFVDGDLFEAWFDAGMVDSIMRISQTSERAVTVDDLAEKLRRIKIAKSKKDKNSLSFVEGMQLQSDDGFVIPTGLHTLDDKLAGGFRRGESTVCAATTGGGKTVLACQFAAQCAVMGRKVIFVTTEQPPHELTPRFLSAQCSIPFNMFTSEPNPGSSVVPSSVSNVRKYSIKILSTISVMNENIRFLDWSQGGGHSIEKDLDAAIEGIMEDPNDEFPAEVIIFDWLGGALKKDANKDLRIMYLDGAEHMHNMAKRMNLSVILFAQLNKVKAYNKWRCDSSMLAECTSIPDKAANAIYVSTKLNDDLSAPSILQKLNVDKARKGIGGMVDMLRDFGHQRFVVPSGTNSV